jgi:hypothetical protein
MSEFDWSKPVLELKDQDSEQEEFDLQPRLLKRRENKLKRFYIEYNKLTRHIVEITPEHRETTNNIRHAILATSKVDLVADIFSGKCPLSKISVIYDNLTKNYDISLNDRMSKKTEFDYVFASADTIGPIHLYCDLVFKKIRIKIDYDKFKKYVSSDWSTEESLQRSNISISIFCMDSTDRTRLFDKLVVNVFELCTLETLEFNCAWLPDSQEEFEKIAFVYYDNDLRLTYSLNNMQHSVLENEVSRPQIVYKQKEDSMIIQSIMMNTSSYKINEQITFYFFDKENPTVLYDVKKIPSASLNNYGVLEIDINFNRPASVITDHLHIYLEDSDVSTDYRF